MKVLRVLNGELTQAQLAEKVGVTRQTILAIETGKYLPSLEVAFKICRVFKMKMEEVFEYYE
ncbi:helix-turn-helix transcriptional regulator [Puniceicoccaceae bacterium K14]|nr:helix-turn-helix transcriptional regulator [Puniceicoccaceae bacterium K14]